MPKPKLARRHPRIKRKLLQLNSWSWKLRKVKRMRMLK
jgi:hypothetical protein